MGPRNEIRPPSKLKLKSRKNNVESKVSQPGQWLEKPRTQDNHNEDLLTLYSDTADRETLRDHSSPRRSSKENLSPNSNQNPVSLETTKSPRLSGLLSVLDQSYIWTDPNQSSVETSTTSSNPDVSMKRKRKDDHRGRKKKSSSDGAETNDIIEVGDSDDESEVASVPDTARRSTRSAAVLPDPFKLCEYPNTGKDSVKVCVADYRSLEHDTFLNDIIIDFYLTWLFHEVLRPEDRATVHLFSSMFYKCLTSTHKAKDSEVQEVGLSSAQKKHARVKGWTKNVNLFEKNFVVFPICEHDHWYLVIAIRPRLITLPVDSEERSIQGEPLFLVLDSLGGTQSGAVTNIRHYLAQEWAAKEAPRHPGRGEVTFTAREMRTLRPKKPEQENFTDCGIYLLYYVEKMFSSLSQFLWANSLEQVTLDWFTTQEVSRKRKIIAETIESLSRDKLTESSLLLPQIPFEATAPRTRSRSRKPIYNDVITDDEEEDAFKDETFSVAASGFYGERSGLRSRGRSNLLDEEEGKGRAARDREHRAAKRRAAEKGKFEVVSDSLSKKVNLTTAVDDLFDRIAASKPGETVPVSGTEGEKPKSHVRPGRRKVAKVPEETGSKSSIRDDVIEKKINSIVQPKDLKSRADLHSNLGKSSEDSKEVKTCHDSAVPIKRKRGLESFKGFDSINDLSRTRNKSGEGSRTEPSNTCRWDKSTSSSPRKAQMWNSINETLSCLAEIEEEENKDKTDTSVSEGIQGLKIEEGSKAETIVKKRINLAEYRSRSSKQTFTGDSRPESEVSVVTDNDPSVVSLVHDSDPDEVSKVSEVVPAADDRDEVSSTAASVVIDGDVVSSDQDQDNTSEVTVASLVSGDSDKIPSVKIVSKTCVDVVDIEDDSEHIEEINGNASKEDELSVEDPDISVVDSKKPSSPDISVVEEKSPTSSVVKEKNPPSPDMFEVDDESPQASRPVSPEIIQITKSIPEDAGVKITLTKSPFKQKSPEVDVSIRVEDDSWEDVDSCPEVETEPASPVFKRSSSLISRESGVRDSPKLKEQSRRLKIPSTVGESSDSSGFLTEDTPSLDRESTNTRPRRKKPEFPNLSEIDKAKLKNLPSEEREKAYRKIKKKEEEKLTSIDLTDDEERRKYKVSRDSPVGKLKRGTRSQKSKLPDCFEVLDGDFR